MPFFGRKQPPDGSFPRVIPSIPRPSHPLRGSSAQGTPCGCPKGRAFCLASPIGGGVTVCRDGEGGVGRGFCRRSPHLWCHLERSPSEIPPSLRSVLLRSSTALRMTRTDAAETRRARATPSDLTGGGFVGASIARPKRRVTAPPLVSHDRPAPRAAQPPCPHAA